MSDDPGSKNSSEDLKNKILASMNTSFTGEATNRWITAMKDEAFDAVEEAVAPATEGSRLNHSMAAVIDRLFDNFKRYSFEYNRTQEDREFEINCERPASMRTSAEYLEMGKPIKYCLGHLASRHWALVIQGEENRILVYITPVEYLVGFKPSPSDFPPHLEMRLSRDTGKTSREFVWSIGGQMLSADSLPVLARRLFTQLVKVTKGEANYGELFALSPQEEKLALAQSAVAPMDRSFDADQSNLLGQKKPDLSARTFVVAAEQVEHLNSAMAASAAPASSNTNGQNAPERPPLNSMLTPNPAATSLSASSSYPQVAAAIANGEPKALNPQLDAARSFPASQSISEQAQTFQKIPAPPQALAQSPAKTFIVESTQNSSDDAIAALIFPTPPEEAAAIAQTAAAAQPAYSHGDAATGNGNHPSTEAPETSQTVPSPTAQAFSSHSPAQAPVEVTAETPLPVANQAHAPVPVSVSVPFPVSVSVSAPALAPDLAPAPNPAPTPAPNPAQAPSQSPSPQPAAAAVSPWVGPNGEPARLATPSRTSIEITMQPTAAAPQSEDSNGHSGLDAEAARARTNIGHSLKGLFEAVDSAINGLTAVGMAAMQGDDLDTVSAVMKQTKSLKAMRDNVANLSKDWQKALDE